MAKEKTKEPINHILVPLHEKLTKDEAEKFLSGRNLTFEKLPRISSSDAAIAHLGAKPGEIIKITRKSATAGEAFFFRGVVE
jgi:DNA-directed RNA polymerase subunit H